MIEAQAGGKKLGMGARRVTSFSRWFRLAAAVACSACGLGSDDAAVPLVVGPVCEGCQPQMTGGESSDFEGGSESQCSQFVRSTRVTDAQALELGFDVGAARSFLERDFTAPLRWTPVESGEDHYAEWDLVGSPEPDPGMPPQGFSEETIVNGSVRAPGGEVTLLELDPQYCDATGGCSEPGSLFIEPCANVGPLGPNLDLVLEIETADGAIQGATLHGTVSGGTPSRFVAVTFQGDLSTVQGTLRLEPTRPGPYLGDLTASVVVWPEAVRGVLYPAVYPDEPDAGVTVYQGPTSVPATTWRHQPLSAQWPGDGCAPGELPIDSATVEGSAALHELAERYPAAQGLVNTTPISAQWDDDVRAEGFRGGEVLELNLELLGAPRPLCTDDGDKLTFESQFHVQSSDGTLDWTILMRGGLRRTPSIFLSHTEHVAAGAPFWSSSLRGIDLFGAPGAQVSFTARYGLTNEDSDLRGELLVRAVPSCEQDFRCEQPNAIRDGQCIACGTPVHVAWLKSPL